MEKTDIIQTNRRNFITSILPACALSCFGIQHMFASNQIGEVPHLKEDNTHKFQLEMERKLTYKKWIIFKKIMHLIN